MDINLVGDSQLVIFWMHQARKKYLEGETIVQKNLPEFWHAQERVELGSFSHKYVKSKYRVVRTDGVIRLLDLIDTPSGAARAYLTVAHPRARKITGIEATANIVHRQPPNYCRAGFMFDAVYLDIRSTYWSIMQRIGWNVNYLNGEYLMAGRAPNDFPFHYNKVSRNCLFSSSFPATREVWDGSRIQHYKGWSKHLNASLIAATMDFLNMVALKMISIGARYVATDGYILPSGAVAEATAFIESFGLTARAQYSGDACIVGSGNYSIGDHATKGFNTVRPSNIDHVWVEERSWVEHTFRTIMQSDAAHEVYSHNKI